ncbi:hypothetical protein JIX56_21140 [Streptomyces sp. CA-210063]|uniref:hypothetical protein n=1 Tax=Streptomyces sp. CA-210063 TaxID=2801029 RepID=UPI00214C6647|nr:hypothetical protein [Streptomyces sp. CA-210063]UUU32207.1 hypothetical protein JIX56_21140 [Streptomyces sp. CA-210063]
MTKDRMALIAGTILSLGLLTACGGDGDPEDTDATGRATPKASASAAKRTGPAYDGAALPGLSKEPAWSLKGDGTSGCVADPAASAARHVINIDVRTCVLGDAVVLTQDMTEYSQAGSVASEEYHFRARLHDAATGKVRRTVDVTAPADWPGGRELSLDQFIQISQWEDGSPALLVVEGDVVAPDGLKKETVSTTYTMYAPSGEKLGSSTLEGEDADNLTAEAGHLLTEEGNKSSTYTPVGGGATVEVRNRGVDQAPLGAGFGYRVGSTYSAVDGSGSRLSVSDRLTGKELWDLGDVDRPAALADVEEAGDLEGSLYALTQDKGLLAWTCRTTTRTTWS